MKVKIFIVLLASLSIWLNWNLSNISENNAYTAGYRSAIIVEKPLVKATPDQMVMANNEALRLINTLVSQLLLLIILFLLIKKIPNKKRNVMDGSVEPPIR